MAVLDGQVRRSALLGRLREEQAARVILVTAPAGSGKTTLLRQWADEDPRPIGWVTATPAFSEPAVLVREIARATADALKGGPVAGIQPSLRGSDAFRNLSRLCQAVALDGRAILLVLDDVHELTDQRGLDVLAVLADQIPATWRIGLAAREAVNLPVARWRITGMLAEVGYADLAMDLSECSQVLKGLGLDPSEEIVRDVHARTEGWAAGVCLAGLSLKAGHQASGEATVATVAGDDEVIRSYLETEMLAGMDPRTYDMLVRTSVLDAVCGPLADAVTGRSGSSARLYELSRGNQLVMALDGQRRWFRYHGLLRDLLARRLEEATPGPADAHRRAAAWYESEGRIDEAIDHSFRAGELDESARLVLSAVPAMYRAGRLSTIQRWIAYFAPEAISCRRELATVAALVAAFEGDPHGATQWAAAAQRGAIEEVPEPGSAALDARLLRGVLCRDGPDSMLVDAQRSLRTHDDDWAWRPTALLAVGAAHAMLGNATEAEAAFEAAEQAPGIASTVARFPLRAERALVAIGHRRWQEAGTILAADRRQISADPDSGRLAGMLWLVADARLAIHRGDRRLAHERLRRAQFGRSRLSWAVPWYAVRTLTEMARAQLLVGDAEGALVSLVRARDTIQARPALGNLTATAEEVTRIALAASTERLPGGSTLTPAELRLLPLLQTYLNFREIGEHLGVSGNTVKTEAMSIYAKLGAASRSEAVTSAVTYGLLEDIFA
jgi:LuxR family maltose regulon positive regulatory protein